MYKNWKILKSELDEKQEEYSNVAQWCNESGQYHIEEQGKYYAVVKNDEPTEEEIKAARIAELKANLSATDYVVIKIAEGAATTEEYTDIIAQRAQWRIEIRELEGEKEDGLGIG
ncbi:MAG: hypothetical protein IJ738_04605 [Alphaproteobacteria bacterium]|nr:hypothetical protein [Alphaproteobacteria bacterium]